MVSAANWVTIGRILATPLFIASLYVPFGNWFAALVFCIIASTDMVDGWLARRHKTVSKAGAVLDPLADKILVAAALIFLIGKGVDAWMAFVIIAREFLVTGIRLLHEEIVSASFLGKLKTVSQIVGIVFVLLELSFAWHIMLIATLLTIISGIEYFWRARKSLSL